MGLKRIIAAAIALALVLIGLAIGFGYTRWEIDRRADYWVDHAHRVIETTLALFPKIQAVTLREQDILAQDSPQAVEAYIGARAALTITESDLTRLLHDNPDQTNRARRLVEDLQTWLGELDSIAGLVHEGRADAARATVAQGALRPLISRAQQDALEIVAVERGLLARRMAAARQADIVSYGIALTLAILALTGLVSLIVALSRANVRLRQAAAETRRSQDARNTSEALIEAVFSNIPDYLMVLDVEADQRFCVADINPALAKAFDVRREDVRGKTLEALFPEDIAQGLTTHYRRVLETGRPARTRGPVPLLPVGPRLWEAIVAPVVNSAGRIDRIVGAIRDVTDQTRAEARLRDSQRMEAIGQLTGGVAHDFNNLLQVIRGNLELLQPFAAEDPTARRRLDHAIMGADRAAQLTAQLLAFARRQPLAPEVIDLAVLAREMSELLRRTLGDSIEVATDIAEGLWPTLADPAQVESALLNLALNARAAMPGGGRLTLRFENAALSAAEAAELELAAGDYVLIAVADTGQGMSEDVLARVFEPFFTTKKDGEGTGLGLSMVYGFVRQSKGAIHIDSRPGEGAQIRIWLPRSAEAPIATAPPQTTPVPGARQLILVVEDEPQVRAAAVATLTDLGYRCREAPDADRALEALDSQVALIFSDVVMPGSLKSQAFAAAAQARAPGVPILFTSGYAHDAITADGALDSGVNLISKPYSRDALARKIGDLLGRAPEKRGL